MVSGREILLFGSRFNYDIHKSIELRERISIIKNEDNAVGIAVSIATIRL
ncbi:MAG: hypothetical protein ACYCTV_06580 [Leptospirales bacterium]